MSAVSRKPKTFKLRALHSQKKFGVAGRSCEEVLRKGCLHLQVSRGWGAGGLRGGLGLHAPREAGSWGAGGPLLGGPPG